MKRDYYNSRGFKYKTSGSLEMIDAGSREIAFPALKNGIMRPRGEKE
jgi:hypothetical protein